MPTRDAAETSPLDHLALLGTMQDAFADTIPRVDPDASVPWCGRWRVRHLVVHLARIHHWAAAQAAGTPEVPLGSGPFELEPFYRGCAAELRTTLEALGGDALCSTLVGPGPVAFWRRRQLHETVVHLWDLRAAGGLALDVAPQVWADTVDEMVTVMQPRQVRMGRMPRLGDAIDLTATDVDRRWRLDCEVGEEVPAAVAVSGSASALALLVWRRIDMDDATLTVRGDTRVLDEALGQRLTP